MSNVRDFDLASDLNGIKGERGEEGWCYSQGAMD